MTTWPLPEKFPRMLPGVGDPGSFWEKRDDRRHCGIDLYAPAGSLIASIEDGQVVCTGIQTDPSGRPYWLRTYFVCIRHESGYIVRYAELGNVEVRVGEQVREGQPIGQVGQVIDPLRVDREAPPYIRKLVNKGHCSMLHLEVYRSMPPSDPRYFGGNWLGGERPSCLCNPAVILGKLVK